MGSAGRKNVALVMTLIFMTAGVSLPSVCPMSIEPAAGEVTAAGPAAAAGGANPGEGKEVVVPVEFQAHVWPQSHLVKREALQRCGKRLAETILDFCHGFTFSGVHKRSVSDFLDHERVKRNIIDECCRQPCPVRTLAKYCGVVRKSRR